MTALCWQLQQARLWHRWVRRHTLTPVQNGAQPPNIECQCGGDLVDEVTPLCPECADDNSWPCSCACHTRGPHV